MTTLLEIVNEVDNRADGRDFGDLQRYRTAARGLKRQHRRVFGGVRNEDWTFHRGGREELQFNLGFEYDNDLGGLRYGVAFSLEPSRTMPNVDLLLPKLARFNDYLRQNPDEFSDLWMWEFAPERTAPHRPAQIETHLARSGVFIFLGNACDAESPDFDAIMDTLDRLMPLYRFVETGDPLASIAKPIASAFRPGCPPRSIRTFTNLAERLLDVSLRHNALQMQLYSDLVADYGEHCVGVEQPAPGGGGRIDVLVQDDSLRIVFEIKTATTARGCIREAVGQLLDYGCWPGGSKVDRLIVVGEPSIMPDEALYLSELNRRFPLPIAYRSVTLADV